MFKIRWIFVEQWKVENSEHGSVSQFVLYR